MVVGGEVAVEMVAVEGELEVEVVQPVVVEAT